MAVHILFCCHASREAASGRFDGKTTVCQPIIVGFVWEVQARFVAMFTFVFIIFDIVLYSLHMILRILQYIFNTIIF